MENKQLRAYVRRVRRSLAVGLAAAAVTGSAAAADAFATLLASAAAPEKRHALVIGNANYAHDSLKNPINDARAIARELAGSGFEVLLVEDGTQAGMQRAIRRFGSHIEQGGVGLFYYAGHGLQVKGRNYLLPVNAEIDREYEVQFNAVDVSLVLGAMDAARNPLNIVILDTCRTNPFFARSLRVEAGLAPMDAPAGTFIAFATSPGAAAADGANGSYGIYTKHLLARISTPGLPIEHLFKKVRIGVLEETRGVQTPWESSSLRGDFAFRAMPAVQPVVSAAAAPTPASPPPRFAAMNGAGAHEAAILSIYFSQLGAWYLTPGARLPKVGLLDERTCKGTYTCGTQGQVIGEETLRVDGGVFETVKAVLQQSWQPRSIEPGASSQNAELWGGRVLTVWYSRETRRVLRVSSRQVHGRFAPMTANFDFDLIGQHPSASQVAARGESR